MHLFRLMAASCIPLSICKRVENMNKENYQLYKTEIAELNNLLNEEWVDLRILLQDCNLDVDNGLLINYYEDDLDNQYGYFINPDSELFFFEIDAEERVKLISKDIDESIETDCPQYIVALDVMRNIDNKFQTAKGS